MIPLVKLLLIGLVAVIGFFGLTETFRFKGQQLSEQIQIPEQIPVEEGKNWLKSIPLQDLKELIVGGVGGVVKWLSNGIIMLLGWILRFIKPDITIPSWFGYLIMGLIGTFLFWKGLETLYDWGHNFGKILLIVITMIFGVVIFALIIGAM